MGEHSSEAEHAPGGNEPLDAWLGLGSNLGRRARMLARALEALGETEGLEPAAVSSVYETDPVGVTDQPAFLNMVARFRCRLSPDELLAAVQAVESKLKRIRTRRWGPRTIDVDILLMGDLSIDTERLTVPHPELTNRQFVLVPMAELAPDLPLPGGHTAGELAEPASNAVRRLGALEEVLARERP
ncbi:MAG: 2-amino-4-hydroxy-6-hydroxymethyldihydropteridine diphosphokinase [Armatimonadota bacterium]